MKVQRIELTEDQVSFMNQMIDDHVLYNPVKQTPNRVAFARRLKGKLNDEKYEVDHSESQRRINEALAQGLLKVPSLS